MGLPGLEPGMAIQGGLELHGIDRLGQDRVDPRFQGLAAVFLGVVGRHRDDRHVAPAHPLQGAHGAGHLEAVHARHLVIHQGHVVAVLAQGLNRLVSVVGHSHTASHSAQLVDEHLLVDGVVLSDQHRQRQGAAGLLAI